MSFVGVVRHFRESRPAASSVRNGSKACRGNFGWKAEWCALAGERSIQPVKMLRYCVSGFFAVLKAARRFNLSDA